MHLFTNKQNRVALIEIVAGYSPSVCLPLLLISKAGTQSVANLTLVYVYVILNEARRRYSKKKPVPVWVIDRNCGNCVLHCVVHVSRY